MAKKPLAIHAFLFALWPVLFSYAQNVGVVPFSEAWRSMAALLGLAAATLIPFALILRSISGGAAIVSLFFVLFFSYGHVHRALWGSDSGYVLTSESLLLMVVWLVLFAAGAGLIIRLKKNWSDITRILNAIGMTLIFLSLVDIGIYYSRSRGSLDVALAPFQTLPQAEIEPGNDLPDIYYLIVDAYGRQDVLEEIYGYDNSEFLDFLEQSGFFVAGKGRANYNQTELSLASSLNLGYLDEVAAAVGPDSNDHGPLRKLIQDSIVIRFLREQGYTIVGLPSGFSPTTLGDPDVYVGSRRAWNDLEVGLVTSTPFPWLTVAGSLPDPTVAHRQRLLDFFDQLAGTVELPSPRFVFGHSVATHVPYVFDGHGNEIGPIGKFDMRDAPAVVDSASADRFREGYTGQLAFFNDRIEPVIEHILSQASRPTIIILQADHGPGIRIDWEDRGSRYAEGHFSILNAIRVPPEASVGLYEEITPVNTFRLIFKHYFGTDLEPLEDTSYFSSYETPYRFVDVTEAVR